MASAQPTTPDESSPASVAKTDTATGGAIKEPKPLHKDPQVQGRPRGGDTTPGHRDGERPGGADPVAGPSAEQSNHPGAGSAGGVSPAGVGSSGAAGSPGRGTKSLPTNPGSAGSRPDRTPGGAGQTGPAGTHPGAGAGNTDIAGKTAKGMYGAAGNLAGSAAQKAIEGDRSSSTRRHVGRYVGAGVSGAVAGAQAGSAAGGVGAAPGAALGAVKGVSAEAGKDAIHGVSKVTGGSPVAEPADKRLGAGGTGYERTSKKQDEGLGATAAKVAAVGGAAAATPPAMAMIMLMSLMAWLKSMFFAFTAMVANVASAIAMFLMGLAKAAWGSVSTPFMAFGGLVAKGAGAVLGVTVAATVAPATAVASAVAVSIVAALLVGGLFAGAMDTAALFDDRTPQTSRCLVDPRRAPGGNPGAFTGEGVPPEAIPWVENAAANSEAGIPAAFFAYLMDRETDFRPGVFADDSNGGTWGLLQINAAIWREVTGGGTFDSPDIRDPMIHTQYAAKYLDARLQTVRTMRQKNPRAAYATELTELEALMIAHNAGEGNLQRYPNLPSVTRSYLAEFRQKFEQYGGGEPGGAPSDDVATVDMPANAAGSRDYGDLGLQPNAAAMAHLIGNYFAIETIGGRRGDGEHINGLAMDFMVPLTAEGSAKGDAIANYLVANADAVGLDNVIWQQRIWTSQRRAEGWRAMADRGSPTQNHMDHPHVLLKANAPVLDRLPNLDGAMVDGLESGVQDVYDDCETDDGRGGPGVLGPGGLADGGMTEADGQALMALYIQEGDAVLRQKFHGGGPGQCNGSYTANCVSFSWYFLTKYTNYDRGYAPGNGVQVAGAVGGMIGKQTSRTPTAYSIFSHGNTSSPSVGHTGIVLGVEGDRILIGEASYCGYAGRARWVESAEWQGWEFLDISTMVSDDPIV